MYNKTNIINNDINYHSQQLLQSNDNRNLNNFDHSFININNQTKISTSPYNSKNSNYNDPTKSPFQSTNLIQQNISSISSNNVPQGNNAFQINDQYQSNDIIWYPKLEFELKYYEELFSIADVNKTGFIQGKEAVVFFSRSNLDKSILREVLFTLFY